MSLYPRHVTPRDGDAERSERNEELVEEIRQGRSDIRRMELAEEIREVDSTVQREQRRGTQTYFGPSFNLPFGSDS